MRYIEPIAKLIAELGKLPSVGEKTAARYAYALMEAPEEDVNALVEAIKNVRENVHFCKICGNFTEHEICDICATRKPTTICVVKEPKDVTALEKVKGYDGVYHVLHGVISPLSGVGPEELRIKELLRRMADTDVREVIMATNPDTEGETTAMYLTRLLKPFGARITRLAYGVPVGGHLEFSDEVTLSRALEGRQEI